MSEMKNCESCGGLRYGHGKGSHVETGLITCPKLLIASEAVDQLVADYKIDRQAAQRVVKVAYRMAPAANAHPVEGGYVTVTLALEKRGIMDAFIIDASGVNLRAHLQGVDDASTS